MSQDVAGLNAALQMAIAQRNEQADRCINLAAALQLAQSRIGELTKQIEEFKRQAAIDPPNQQLKNGDGEA